MGVNGVPVAPHGLILGENEATPSRKLFKYLLGLCEPISGPKSTTGGPPEPFWASRGVGERKSAFFVDFRICFWHHCLTNGAPK